MVGQWISGQPSAMPVSTGENDKAPRPIRGTDRRSHPVAGSRRRMGREARRADRRQFELPDRSAAAQSRRGMRTPSPRCSGMPASIRSTCRLNVGNLEFKRAIRKFETTADQADIAVVYYAGHGLEIGGTNYLIPTDARLASDRDADDEAIPLERLVSSADGAKRLRLVILDACRDNPFATSMRRERKIGQPCGAAGPRPGRADQHRHPDRLRGEGRLDRRRRRRPAQPVHGGGAEKSDRSRPRRPPRLRTGQGRGDEDDRQPAGAVRLRLARRRQHLAGAAARDVAGRAGDRRQGRLRPGPEDRIARGPGKCFSAPIRPASMPTSRARRSRTSMRRRRT